MVKDIGDFRVEVSEPFPCNVKISHKHSQRALMFSHCGLRDLEYAVVTAIREVNAKLARHSETVDGPLPTKRPL